MKSLHLTQSHGLLDRPSSSLVALIDDGDGVQFRVAHCAADLPHAHWRDIAEPVCEFAWSFIGSDAPFRSQVFAEVRNADDSSVIVSASEMGRVGTALFPLARLNPASGVILRADCTEHTYPLCHYTDARDTAATPGGISKFLKGNVFVPLVWHPGSGGHGWITSNMWEPDEGETPDCVIVARTNVNDFSPYPTTLDLSASSVRILAEVAASDINFHGGGLVFEVVSTLTDGRRGRWRHNRNVEINGGDGQFYTSNWPFPSGSNPDWFCTWAANGVPIGEMPSGPNVAAINEIGLVLQGWSAFPTGKIMVKRLEFTN